MKSALITLIFLFATDFTFLFPMDSFANTATEKVYDVKIDIYKNGKLRGTRYVKTVENLPAKISQENQFGYMTYSEVTLKSQNDGSTLVNFESGEILPDDNFIIKEDIVFKETDFFKSVHFKSPNNNYEYIVSIK